MHIYDLLFTSFYLGFSDVFCCYSASCNPAACCMYDFRLQRFGLENPLEFESARQSIVNSQSGCTVAKASFSLLFKWLIQYLAGNRALC